MKRTAKQMGKYENKLLKWLLSFIQINSVP